MSTTDPIGDMLTKIRNANLVYKPYVDVSISKLKQQILDVLRGEQYIKDYELIEINGKKRLRIHLRYFPGRKRAITEIKRISTPGRRIYVNKTSLPVVKNGMGIAVLTTSKGILSNKQAKQLGVGGEILFTIW